MLNLQSTAEKLGVIENNEYHMVILSGPLIQPLTKPFKSAKIIK